MSAFDRVADLGGSSLQELRRSAFAAKNAHMSMWSIASLVAALPF